MDITPVSFGTPVSLGDEAKTQGRVPAKPNYEANSGTTSDNDRVKLQIPADVAQQLVATVLLKSFPHLGAANAQAMAKQMLGEAVKADQKKADKEKADTSRVDVSA